MLVAVLPVLLLLVARTTDACSCYQQPLQTVLCTASTLVKVEVFEEVDRGIDFSDLANQRHSREFRARVDRVFRGDVPESEIMIQTASNSALCGVHLTTDSWLLELDIYSGNYQVSLCKLHRRWDFDIDDDLMRDLMEDTLDCDCQPSTRYGRSPCCSDYQDSWSVTMCSSHFGKCSKQPDRGNTCGWEADNDYEECLGQYGFYVNDDLCVDRRPCPESAEYRYSMFEQVTCQDSVATKLAFGKEMCMCPEDRPYLDTDSNRCVTGMECPRGDPIHDPSKAKDSIHAELNAMVTCPANQVYFGNHECLPCLQNCGSNIAWCTRICITNECGCPDDKPVMVLDTCYTQDQCENIDTSLETATSSTGQVTITSPYQYQSSPPTEDTSSSPYMGDKTSSPTDASTTSDLPTSPPTQSSSTEMMIESSSPTDDNQFVSSSSTTDQQEESSPSTEDSGDITSPTTVPTTSYNEIESSPPTDVSSPLTTDDMSSPTTDAAPGSSTSAMEDITSPTTVETTSRYEDMTSPTTQESTSRMGDITSPPTDESTSRMGDITSPPTDGSTTTERMMESTTTEGMMESSPTTEGMMESSPTTERMMESSPSTDEMMESSPTTDEMMESSPTTERMMESSPTTDEMMSTSGFREITSPPTEISSTSAGCIGLACIVTDKTTDGMVPSSSTEEPTDGMMMSSTSQIMIRECGENEVYNECASSCVRTCSESCDDDFMMSNDDMSFSMNFGNNKCEQRCECEDGYVLHNGRCIPEKSCPVDRLETVCQRQAAAVIAAVVERGVTPFLLFCDEEGNYLPKQCVGRATCTCVDRTGIPILPGFYFSVDEYECDFDEGIICPDNKVFEKCRPHDRLCNLLPSTEHLECTPGCRCPDNTPYSDSDGQCINESECETLVPYMESVDNFFDTWNLKKSDMLVDPEACTNNNPTCEQWAARNLCSNGYLIKNCKKACNLCEATEMPLTCQGRRDAMTEFLAEQNVFGIPDIICRDEDPDSYFPRQCIGSVCHCVDEDGVMIDDQSHHISHFHQCPNSPECPAGQVYLDCTVLLTCNDDEDVDCTQGCGCPPDRPYYVEEDGERGPYCASRMDVCESNDAIVFVTPDMSCEDAVAHARKMNLVEPSCDPDRADLYAPRQCAGEMCYCVNPYGVPVQNYVEKDSECPGEVIECEGNKIRANCESWCPLTCDNVLDPWSRDCTDECSYGCRCPDSTIENQDGECVPSAFFCPGFQDNLPTECSERERLFVELGMENVKPECDSQGMFEYEQCFGNSCVCVRRETGEQMADSEHRRGDGTDCEFMVREAEADCRYGQEFTLCGQECDEDMTCSNLMSTGCADGCVAKCQCPEDRPIFDEEARECIAVSDCPVMTTPTPTMDATTSSSPHRSDYHMCHQRDGYCACYSEEGPVIPDSTRGFPDFFAEIGQTPYSYCEYRRDLASGRPCAVASRAGDMTATCTPDGMYAPVQCGVTDPGVCVCVDEYGQHIPDEDGNPILHYEEDLDIALSRCMRENERRYENFPCLSQRLAADRAANDMLVGTYQPNCLSDGRYDAAQCHGSECNCVTYDGEEIPGTVYGRGQREESWCRGIRDTYMASHCYINRDEDTECLSDGRYAPTKCDGDMCHCVEPFYGREVPYSDHLSTDDYECEMRVGYLMEMDCFVAMGKSTRAEDLRDMPMCNALGEFHHTQCEDESTCYCADIYGNELDDSRDEWEDNMYTTEQFEEYCESRWMKLSESKCWGDWEADRAGGFNISCTDNGEYVATQCQMDEYGGCFCVDVDGEVILDSEGPLSVEYCENFRVIYAESDCYQDQRDGSSSYEIECTPEGSYRVSQCRKFPADQCVCVNPDSGEEITDTEHNREESYRCGDSDDPFVPCSERPEEDGYLCRPTGGFFSQQCAAPGDCTCVDKWGMEIESSEHDVTEFTCFEDMVEDLSRMTGEVCDVARTIAGMIARDNSMDTDSVYIPECTDQGRFFPRQCYGATCFCVDDEGAYVSGSEHDSDNMDYECRDVLILFEGPDSYTVGSSASFTCTILSAHEDTTLTVLVDGAEIERAQYPWSEAQFSTFGTDFQNGTVSTAIEVYVPELMKEHNETTITCSSDKFDMRMDYYFELEPIEPTMMPTTEEATTMMPTTTPMQTTEPAPVYVRICNEKRGCVYAQSENLVVASGTRDLTGDNNSLFEYMDDMTLRSAAYPDLYLTQALAGGQITIALKPYKGSAIQTWLRDTDQDGDDRVYVNRPSKGQKVPYYLDYFKRALTGYKATERPNQKWAFYLESGEPFSQ